MHILEVFKHAVFLEEHPRDRCCEEIVRKYKAKENICGVLVT